MLIFVPVSSVYWPKYSLDTPKNFVFDANITSFVEDDFFRAEAIGFLNQNIQLFGR